MSRRSLCNSWIFVATAKLSLLICVSNNTCAACSACLLLASCRCAFDALEIAHVLKISIFTEKAEQQSIVARNVSHSTSFAAAVHREWRNSNVNSAASCGTLLLDHVSLFGRSVGPVFDAMIGPIVLPAEAPSQPITSDAQNYSGNVTTEFQRQFSAYRANHPVTHRKDSRSEPRTLE